MNVFVWNSGFEFDPIQLESETRIVLPYAREGRMPPKRYQSRFPTARIKKIMQLDDDVGKVASSVPLLISRAVEMFLQKMLTSSADYVGSRTSKTITASHMKYVINNDPLFHFLREEVAKVPDVAEASEEQEDGRKKRGRKRATDPGAVKHSESTDDFSEPKRKKKINPKKESEPSNSFSDEKDGIVPSNFKSKPFNRRKVIVSSDKPTSSSQEKNREGLSPADCQQDNSSIPQTTQKSTLSGPTPVAIGNSNTLTDNPVPTTVIKSIPIPVPSLQLPAEQAQN